MATKMAAVITSRDGECLCVFFFLFFFFLCAERNVSFLCAICRQVTVKSAFYRVEDRLESKKLSFPKSGEQGKRECHRCRYRVQSTAHRGAGGECLLLINTLCTSTTGSGDRVYLPLHKKGRKEGEI